MSNLLEILKKYNIKPDELARQLEINTGQIYRWNKQGVKKTNKYAKRLKEMFPELQLTDTKRKLNGDEDLRSYSEGAEKSQLKLTNINETTYKEKKFIGTVHPVLTNCKDEYGLPFVPTEDRDREWYEKRKNLDIVDPFKTKGINWDQIPNP